MQKLNEKQLHELITKERVRYSIGVPKETAPGSGQYTVGGNLAICVHTLTKAITFDKKAPEHINEGYPGDKLIYNERAKIFFIMRKNYWENESEIPNSPIIE